MISQSLFNPFSQGYANNSAPFRSPLDLFNLNPFSAAQDVLYQSQLSKRSNPYADYEATVLASNIQKKLKTQNDNWTPVNNSARDFPDKSANKRVINLEDDSDDECVIIEKPKPQKKVVSEPLVVKDNFLDQINPMFNETNFSINSTFSHLMNQMAKFQRTQFSPAFYAPKIDIQVQKPGSPVIIIDEEDQAAENKKESEHSLGFSDCRTDSTLTPKGAQSEKGGSTNLKFKKDPEDSETESEASYTPNDESQEATIPALCMTRPAKGTGRRVPKQVWNPNTIDRNTIEQYYTDLSKLTRKDITNEEVALNTLKMCEMDVSKTLALVKQNRAIYRDLFSTKKRVSTL